MSLKLFFYFISQIILRNVFKIIVFISIVIASLAFLNTDYQRSKLPIVKEFDYGVDHVYVYLEDGQFQTIKKHENVEISNGHYIKTEVSELSYYFIIYVFFALFWLFFMSLDKGEDGWEINKIWVDSVSGMIECEYEDGEYYYIIFNRLILKSDEKVSDAKVINSIGSYRNIKKLPKIKTRRKRRHLKIKDLLY